MDLYVEHQAISQVLAGDLKKFILLYEANFEALYRYVYRRVGDPQKIEEIVRLTFVDALAHNDEISRDYRFVVWLYALAKKRVWAYYKEVNFQVEEVIDVNEDLINQEQAELVKKLESTFLKLTLEEREIIRLKFFEDLADVDVSEVLSGKTAISTSQIYRVMKRLHFLLFGDTNVGEGVYFAQLSGLISKIRDVESIEVPEALFVSLRVDLMSRIERQDFAVNQKENAEIKEAAPVVEENIGSDDPAKIFVEAVREMREESYEEFESREKILDILDKFKPLILIFPALLLCYLLYLGFSAVFGPFDNAPVVYAEKCQVEINFNEEFNEEEKKELGKRIANPLCEYFDESLLEFDRVTANKVEVKIDSDDWAMQYRFEKDSPKQKWKIRRYVRAAYRN
jgi:RNA polymerase sigma-70 factor (ECF subfamily)